jgi:hypothetical protein
VKLGGERELRVAAVGVKPCGAKIITKIFIAPLAEGTSSATGMNPRNANPVPGFVRPDLRPNRMNSPHDFMARHNGVLGRHQAALDFVDFRVANSANGDLDENVVRTGSGNGQKGRLKGLSTPCFNQTGFFEHHRSQCGTSFPGARMRARSVFPVFELMGKNRIWSCLPEDWSFLN